MRLYFIRHGESEANVQHIISNRGLKHGLTGRGRQQVATCAEALKGLPIAKLFSSPLLRARQSAEILGTAFGLEYEIADALCEYDCGVLEGRSDDEAWASHHAVTTDWFGSHKWESRAEGGECFLDIKARFVPFVEQLVEGRHNQSGDVALVGHGGTYISMLPLVMKNIDHGFALENKFSNAGYVIAETTPDSLLCVEWCGVAP